MKYNKKLLVVGLLALVLSLTAVVVTANLKLTQSKSLWPVQETYDSVKLVDHYSVKFIMWPNVKQIWVENKSCGSSPINFTTISCMDYVRTDITFQNETVLDYTYTSLVVDGTELDLNAMDVSCNEINAKVVCESNNVGDSDSFVLSQKKVGVALE